MITLNRVLASVLEKAGESSEIGKAIYRLWGQRSKEGELQDAWAALEEQARISGDFDELDKVIHFGNEDTKIDELIGDSEWWDSLDASVKQMEAHSNCGADCLALIIRADMVMCDMLDVSDTDFRTTLMRDVARQCEVFVNG
jgi:hypothetical protein